MTTAILARTNRALRVMEEALGASGTKYHLLGKTGFWQQPEVKAAIAYLTLVLYPADYAIAGAIRAPFHPAKYLPKTKLLARLKELQDGKEPSYWHLLAKEPHTLGETRNQEAITSFTRFVYSLSRYRDQPSGVAVKSVLTLLQAFDYYAAEEDADNSPVDNLTDLVKIAARHNTLKDFLDYCRRVTAASKSKKGVALGTIHSAKGLEFSRVFLIGCQEGLIPHAKSTDEAEERNLFFVAASRPERDLVITYAGRPSKFLTPFLKEQPCEIVPDHSLILGTK